MGRGFRCSMMSQMRCSAAIVALMAMLPLASHAGAQSSLSSEGASASSEGHVRKPSAESDAIFLRYRLHVERTRRARLVSGAALAIGGAGVVGAGFALADDEPARFYFMLLGGAAVGVGSLKLLLPSEPEQTAQRFGGLGCCHSAEEGEALRAEWQHQARRARTWRITEGVLASIWSAGFFAMGAASLALPDSNFESEGERLSYAAFGLAGGSVLGALAAIRFILPSRAEESFAELSPLQHHPSKGTDVELSFAPLHSGAFVGVRGAF